jgi:hypothetical protein
MTAAYNLTLSLSVKKIQLKQQTAQRKNWDENIFHAFLGFSSYFLKN